MRVDAWYASAPLRPCPFGAGFFAAPSSAASSSFAAVADGPVPGLPSTTSLFSLLVPNSICRNFAIVAFRSANISPTWLYDIATLSSCSHSGRW